MKREEFIPVFLKIIGDNLQKTLPVEGSERTLRTCSWFEIEHQIKHIRLAENSVRKGEIC